MNGRKGSIRVVYVTLQATTEGQAAYAHVHEIVKGLRKRAVEIEVCEVRYDQEPGHLKRLWSAIRVQMRAVRQLSRADVAYVRMHLLTLPVILMARLMRKPVALEVNGPYSDAYVIYPSLKRIAKLLEWSGRAQLKLSSLVIAVTDNLATWVRGQASTDTIVISNGANTELFRPSAELRAEIKQLLPESYAVFFGSLSPWQGIDVMLRATKSDFWPRHVGLVVVGDGAMRETVEAAAGEAGSRVTYIGQQGYEAVPGIVRYSVASLIVKHGPFDEGGLMPLKLFESMAVGVPVVVTDYPGIASLVREIRGGTVVGRDAPDQVAAAVSDLAQQEGDWNHLAEWVAENASWDARASQTLAALTSMLANGT